MCLSACFRRSEPPPIDLEHALATFQFTKEVCNRTINTALSKAILEQDSATTGQDLYILRPGLVEDQLILDQHYLDTKHHRSKFRQIRIQVTWKKGVPYVDETRVDEFIQERNKGFEPAPLLAESITKVLRATQKNLKHHKALNQHFTPEKMYAAIKMHTGYVNALRHKDYETILIESNNRNAFLIWEVSPDSPVVFRRVPSTLKMDFNKTFKDFMLAYFDGKGIVHHAFHISTTGHVIDTVWGFIFTYFDTDKLEKKEEAFLPSLFPKLTPFTE